MERMPETNDPVDRFIALIREIDPRYMTDLFQNGGCFHLFLIVREKFPEAEAWWTPVRGHVFIKVGRRWYDIRGRRKLKPVALIRVDNDFFAEGEAREWLRLRLSCQYGEGRALSHLACRRAHVGPLGEPVALHSVDASAHRHLHRDDERPR